MGWSIRNKLQPGWMAVGWDKDRENIDLVHVKRGLAGRPAVAFCESFRQEGSDAVTLARLRKTLKLDRYRCTTLLPSDQYQLHYIDAPAVPAAEVKAAVRWRVKDIIDYPIESATVDVLTVPADGEGSSREPALFAVTARTDAIAACTKPFEESRVALGAVDIPDLAQRNLAALLEHDGDGAALLAFYDEGGLLIFTRGGELLLSRRIEVGLGALFNADGTLSEDSLERITLETQRSLDHFDYQFPQVAVAKLMLAPLPREVDMAARLSSSLGIPVGAVDFAGVIDFPAVPELAGTAAQSHFMRLIGAALRSDGIPYP